MNRRLRIVVSVFFGVLTLLLLIIWIRSYFHGNGLIVRSSDSYPLHVYSTRGMILVIRFQDTTFGTDPRYEWITFEKWTAVRKFRTFEVPIWEWNTADGTIGLLIPYWLIVIIVGALAALPWIRWPRRFTLRTLFIVMTMVAVLLVLWFAT